MAWIESHQQLGRHPKLLRLAGMLRIHRAQAIGHLQYLWWWALDYAPTGDTSALTPAEISAASEWQGEPSLFQNSLKNCGWIDPDGRLHDWMDYAGRLIEQRQAEREKTLERVRRYRDKGKGNAGVTPLVTALHGPCNGGTQPNRTVPTEPTQPEARGAPKPRPVFVKPTASEVSEYSQGLGTPIDGEAFVAFYESKGWVIGKSPMKSWQAAVVTWIKRQKAQGGTDGRVAGEAAPVPGKYAGV